MSPLTSVTPANLTSRLKDGEDYSGVVLVGGAEGGVQEDRLLPAQQTKERDNTLDLLPRPTSLHPHLEYIVGSQTQ